MAISKQRLEELIEQGATIYDIFKGDIYLVDLTMVKYYDVPKYIEYKNDYYNCNLTRSINDLFETKEDAKWELEMTATRTETLKLPKWEEIFNDKEVCYNGVYDCWWQNNAHKFGIYFVAYIENNKFEEGSIRVNNTYFNGITKENYIEACKLCLKLFKGAEVERLQKIYDEEEKE